MQEYVKTVIAPYKYPREIEFVTELPKTISGKIRRVELRERNANSSIAGAKIPGGMPLLTRSGCRPKLD